MIMQIVTKVRLFNSPFTVCYINEDHISLPKEHANTIGIAKAKYNTIPDGDHNNKEDKRSEYRRAFQIKTTALLLQPLLKACYNSHMFRRNIIRNLVQLSGNESETILLKLKLEPPDKELIDYAWNERILYLVMSRAEIENAFAWLSTLGGAYSALGDYFEHCAEKAGRISVRQYKLSRMLGDDSLAARSKLYSALAISQKGNLKLARGIVKEVAAFARSTYDKRLNRMCQGVWAKLKYLRQFHSNINGRIVRVQV
ncbi:unnamed protein product [Leptosia nina]|uniref:Uncharacterized protein n=1 Tax=Leptosia nina TaxID=320188 RepID=A0AAV1IYT8_9NEOP